MSPFCFLHFTDPHLPPPGEAVLGGDPAPGFAAALADAPDAPRWVRGDYFGTLFKGPMAR